MLAYRLVHVKQFCGCFRHAAAKMTVPKLLDFEQKQRRMNIAQEMLTRFKNDPDLLETVITGDES